MAITPIRELVAQAKAVITSHSTEETAKRVEAGEAVLVDIRDPRELQRDGKLPGALHAPRGMLEFWIDPSSPYHKAWLDTDKEMIFYCASAWRSALTVKALQEMGCENISEMEGGFSAWKKEERPIEQS